ncbi:Unknown protein [Striga hermonthica]|uniref:F-box associated domain-containing protein n=1 Tax=Striga hermonthica TaxID=68872 RepID=A0A9N7R4F1_STRHE|nr:Unknown protein [Striga hermonthica]
MEYKVVHTFDSDFYVLTLGVDDVWRRVECGHLTRPAQKLLSRSTPLVTEGYMHLVHPEKNLVVMLDLETEAFRQLRCPPGKKRANCGFLVGDSLSCSAMHGRLSWGVWELRPGTGEWKKLPGIELGGRAQELENLCGKRWCDCLHISGQFEARPVITILPAKVIDAPQFPPLLIPSPVLAVRRRPQNFQSVLVTCSTRAELVVT